ncbi:MAG: hypothetical protein IIV55_03350 [Alistipes sp.]|nr:hypothetical protein [Alistipes sp.]
MTSTKHTNYITPDVEVITVSVEQGYSLSEGSTTPEYKEDDDIIVIG